MAHMVKSAVLGDMDLIPGLRGSLEKEWLLLQYSSLEHAWTEEPGGIQSMGPQNIGHDCITNTTQV